ncbi:MAG: polysaccharide biosynthesis protein [Cyanobacteria bacterium J083]|nr:MAG: polysaccharide biosynthesis protein [Cyanobacteria bacterium J083]
MVMDSVLFLISIYGALCLRFNALLPTSQIFEYSWLIGMLIVLKLAIFRLRKIYRPILRYTDMEFLMAVVRAIIYSSGILVIFAYLKGNWPLPRSVLMLDGILTLVLIIGARLSIRTALTRLISAVNSAASPERFVIYGAGESGCQLARLINNDPGYEIVAFVDDNPDLENQIIQGKRVYASSYLPRLLRNKPFDTVLLAMPGLSATRKKAIITQLQSLPIIVKTIPSVKEILSKGIAINQIRQIDVADLLGREEVLPHPELLGLNVTGKSVLVTGAGGSIGSELCRQIAQLQPKSLILLELNEYSLYSIDMELREKYLINPIPYLGTVTNQAYLEKILRRHRVETIYHTAAYKHVPLVEANPGPGVYNNVVGTLKTATAAINCQVNNFVLISTDKAVRPTNIMGASKRIAELIIQALSDNQRHHTCFALVRFGNVLDSSGSVVPRFRQQIAQRQPITLTHREITRYFMSIPEAVRLVIQAGALAKGGEVFLLDMGEPIKIYDLAVQMIKLSGLVPDKDIPIEITGLRPGEKLYEELLINGDNAEPTQHSKIYCAREYKIPWQELYPMVNDLIKKAEKNDYLAIVTQINRIVPEYQNSQLLKSQLIQQKPLRNFTGTNSFSSMNGSPISG